MPFWILLAILVYYVGLFLPSLFLIPRIGFGQYLGSRDGDPEPGKFAGRAKRAHGNYQENLAPFLALGVLAMIVPDIDMAMAILGAKVFVFARLAFLPLYVMAVPLVRSAAWTAGLAGMAMMAFALL